MPGSCKLGQQDKADFKKLSIHAIKNNYKKNLDKQKVKFCTVIVQFIYKIIIQIITRKIALDSVIISVLTLYVFILSIM